MVLKSALPLPIKPQRKHLTTNTHLLKPTFPNFFLGTTLPPENIGNSPPPHLPQPAGGNRLSVRRMQWPFSVVVIKAWFFFELQITAKKSTKITCKTPLLLKRKKGNTEKG